MADEASLEANTAPPAETLVPRSLAWDRLVNTRYFSEAAIEWKRNGGHYTKAPVGSREFREYWDIQEKRCRNGYSVGDTWITGRHYDFLNFTQISKIPDAKIFAILKEKRDKRGNISITAMEKIMDFPRFYEIGWQWYRFKHIARFGGNFLGVQSPGSRHICCAKTRGAGFSYMEAQDGVYNFKFIPGSKSFYFAGALPYLIADGIMNKVREQLEWTNANIPYWYQNRMEHDTLLHMKASYTDSFNVTRGNLSEIIGVVLDNPEKARGKRGMKLVFEEAGSFKDLKKALAISKGLVNDGSFSTGQIAVFGTGGEEGPSIEGLEEVFDQPAVYDMLEFPNVWDEGMESTTCGFFVPATHTDVFCMDEDGNVDVQESLDQQLIERAKAAKAKDPKELDRRKAEYPIVPKEVFSRLTRNPFPIYEIDRQLNYIAKSAAVQDLLRYGDLVAGEENGWSFKIMTREQARPLDDYPHNQQGDLEGCITVVERPFLDQSSSTPPGIYQMVFDPCYKDESDDVTSLWDATIWKNYNQWTTINENLPVAWYVGRPKDLQDAIKRMFNMAMWYNAKIQGEIAGGGQAVLDYAKRHHLLHMLDFDNELTDNREVTEKKNRSYLMNMPTEKKRMGLTYFINWMLEQRGIRDDKTPIYNVHKVLKVRLLKECRKFDGKKNADSISNAILAMFSLKEKQNRVIQDAYEDDDFYSRPLFDNYEDQDSRYITTEL